LNRKRGPPFSAWKRCPSISKEVEFSYKKRGHYSRECDGRPVQRFHCKCCDRGFSTQTFRVDYRFRKPHLDVRILEALVSKCTLRKCARNHGVRRETIERRVIRFGNHCQQLNRWALDRQRVPHIPHESFSMDELESFETDRLLKPVTMPLLIERESRYILHAEVAPLPARKPLSARNQRRLAALEKIEGVRQSGSLAAVKSTLEQLAKRVPEGPLVVVTDKKTTYASELKRIFGERAVHEQVSSKERRDEHNSLFPINHTLAMARDCVAKLVRRSWAHAKRAARLELHTWIWIAFRNLVRPRFVVKRKLDRTPAQLLGLTRARWSAARLIRWRVWGLPD